MRSTLFWLVFASLALIAPPLAQAQWWNPLAPKTYEDCVLKGMKGVSGDEAAYAVMRACRKKFPVKEGTCRFYRNLTKAEEREITGSSEAVGTSWTATIYNGTSVSIWKATARIIINGVSRDYEGYIQFPIAPKTVGKITATILEPISPTAKSRAYGVNYQTCRF